MTKDRLKQRLKTKESILAQYDLMLHEQAKQIKEFQIILRDCVDDSVFKMCLTLLRDLADLQNDAPLETYRKEWEETMQKVYDFLDKHEDGFKA